MSLLISAHQLSKSHSHKQLFSNLSFGIHEGDRIALLGPNGAGKSTLLKILAGLEPVDGGQVAPRSGLRLAYVPQDDIFPENKKIVDILQEALVDFGYSPGEAQVQGSVSLSMAGFENHDVTFGKLSGGWKKRMNLSLAFAKDSDLLLLDEPTNHLDWDGILWLESTLKAFKKSFLIVSHDRQFLKNLSQDFMEISPAYEQGFLRHQCDYEDFLQKRHETLVALKDRQQVMANKARREIDWLRAGVKARTTKSQSRIKQAHELIENLDELKQRNQLADTKVRLDIASGGKKSKKLIEAKNVDIFYDDHFVLRGFDILLGPKRRLGLL
ncbi:MAG: ATP-binding cassette domain-containing protein, partial [Pseudomonadota bacterium]